MDRPLAAFDIETIPDPELGRRLFGIEGNDETVIEAMLRRRLEETEGIKDFHQPPYHRIVTIAVAWLDPSSSAFKLGVPGGDILAEPELLRAFFKIIENAKVSPRLVTWNGGGFDLPVVRYRAMLHGIPAPLLNRTHGDWKYNNYLNRYHDMHVDLMDVLTGYGASERARLDDLCRIMGLPGKTVTEGSKVYIHMMRGEVELVREYCELDALNTLMLYLLWAVHRGRLTHPDLRKNVETIIAGLRANESRKAWQQYADALENWPAWAK